MGAVLAKVLVLRKGQRRRGPAATSPRTPSCEIRVKNAGALVDRFTVTVEDRQLSGPPSTSRASTSNPECEPGIIPVSFQPPRAPTTLPGPTNLLIRAASREDPWVSETAAGCWWWWWWTLLRRDCHAGSRELLGEEGDPPRAGPAPLTPATPRWHLGLPACSRSPLNHRLNRRPGVNEAPSLP